MIKDTLHLRAPGNWINDPNGFIYYKGKYHLFYQYFPYAPEWGTMHWGHAVSEDLLHWNHLGVALYPTKDYDRNGIFSGSALEKDGKMYLYYSAVKYLETEDEDIHHAKGDAFETSQAMLVSEDGFAFDNMGAKKQIIPVVRDESIADATHTRDPKVWKYGDMYYMILGSTISGKKGRVLFYKSADGVNWEYVSQYSHENFGTILECPDLFEIQGQYVFQGSPMNILEDGLEYVHHSICTLVDFREGECGLSLPKGISVCGLRTGLVLLHQTNVGQRRRRVMVAWLRMPEAVKEDSERGILERYDVYAQNDGGTERTYLFPYAYGGRQVILSKEVQNRKDVDYDRPFRLQTTLKEGDVLDIGGYRIYVEEDCVKADRSRVFGNRKNYRMVSSTPQLKGSYGLDIVVDKNLIEIFVNNGEYVISNVVYNLQRELTGPIEKILAGWDDENEKK